MEGRCMWGFIEIIKKLLSIVGSLQMSRRVYCEMVLSLRFSIYIGFGDWYVCFGARSTVDDLIDPLWALLEARTSS